MSRLSHNQHRVSTFAIRTIKFGRQGKHTLRKDFQKFKLEVECFTSFHQNSATVLSRRMKFSVTNLQKKVKHVFQQLLKIQNLMGLNEGSKILGNFPLSR